MTTGGLLPRWSRMRPYDSRSMRSRICSTLARISAAPKRIAHRPQCRSQPRWARANASPAGIIQPHASHCVASADRSRSYIITHLLSSPATDNCLLAHGGHPPQADVSRPRRRRVRRIEAKRRALTRRIGGYTSIAAGRNRELTVLKQHDVSEAPGRLMRPGTAER